MRELQSAPIGEDELYFCSWISKPMIPIILEKKPKRVIIAGGCRRFQNAVELLKKEIQKNNHPIQVIEKPYGERKPRYPDFLIAEILKMRARGMKVCAIAKLLNMNKGVVRFLSSNYILAKEGHYRPIEKAPPKI